MKKKIKNLKTTKSSKHDLPFYKKNKDLFAETKFTNGKRFFPLTMLDILTAKLCSMRTKSKTKEKLHETLSIV
jgi:hypothetical protein